MRAAVFTEPGSPPRPGDFDEPVAGDGKEVAEVILGGLNPVDLKTAASRKVPSVAGMEGIANLGGRRVYFGSAIRPHGSFAPRTLLDPDTVFDVPEGLEDGPAVALGIAGLAAWLPLTHQAGLSGGERTLILGATGLAGQIAVQAAKLLGAGHVVAAGRDEAALEALLDRGADAVAVLDGDDPSGPLGAAAGEGYDVIVDYVFGAPFEAALAHGARGATAVVVGAGASSEAAVAFGALQGKTIVGHGNQTVPLGVRAEAYAAMAEHVLAGRLAFAVERYPLERVEEAWEAQAASPHRKLVVVPED